MIKILEDISDLIFGNKRLGALQHFAHHKGFAFYKKMNPLKLPKEILGMQLFFNHPNAKLKGVLSKSEHKGNTEVMIGDLVHFKDFKSRGTTLFLYENTKLDLPSFTVSPRSTMGQLGSILSSTEWSDVNKSFDRKYEVSSEQMNHMRMMITFQFAETMLALDGFHVVGVGKYVLFYKSNTQIDTIDMDNCHTSALELVDIMMS